MSVSLSPEETERYARHLVMPEIGGPGQQKLKSAKIAMIGAGGLGAPALQFLAAAGVGQLTIIDDDLVSLSNLQRQVIHDSGAIGRRKTDSAKTAISRLNPHVQVNALSKRISAGNAAELIEGHNLVLDGSDNFTTRYLMADTCAETHIPLITAAVNRFDGTITTLKPWMDNNPRYQDLFPTQPRDDLLPSCSQTGVLGAVTGVMGTLMALEAIKEITETGTGLVGKLLMVDTLYLRFETISYRRKSS
ncbi:MAG: molybdopterin-synthase adenylyltransferase MoeB [Rhizobiaceae bacterium]